VFSVTTSTLVHETYFSPLYNTFLTFSSYYKNVLQNRDIKTEQILISNIKGKVKVKVKLPCAFFLAEHHAMKAYWGVEV
jgi:hypothetical protein